MLAWAVNSLVFGVIAFWLLLHIQLLSRDDEHEREELAAGAGLSLSQFPLAFFTTLLTSLVQSLLLYDALKVVVLTLTCTPFLNHCLPGETANRKLCRRLHNFLETIW